jgi:hypothetical protein
MFGIEAEYVVGDCIDQPISEAKYNKHKDDEEYKFKRVIKNEDGKVTLGDRHAWVKAKIDGKWYNFDPTFDADSYAREGIPKYVFLSDDEISDHGNSRISMTGPECKDSMPIYTQPPQFIKADEVEHKEEKKPSVVGKLFTVLFEKIRNTFKRKDQKLLDSGQQEGSMPNAGAMKKTEEQYPSWDLRGYKDAKKIIAPQQISTKDRNLDGKEKDDGR